MYKSRKTIVSKFVEKLLKYRTMFKDILTFLGFDNRRALLITLCFVVLRISISKIRSFGKLLIILHKNLLPKKLKSRCFPGSSPSEILN